MARLGPGCRAIDPTLGLIAASFVAVCGWLCAGFAPLAASRVDRVAGTWRNPVVQGVGFLIAVLATVAAGVVSAWWWSLVVLIVAPNVAAILVMMATPRR